jgi:hypothetical protein
MNSFKTEEGKGLSSALKPMLKSGLVMMQDKVYV